jgi:molybdopterin/thiamine biosynthesis adenylyltransferase
MSRIVDTINAISDERMTQFNIDAIHIIGVGGNGSNLLLSLVKYLNGVNKSPFLHLYDADVIEESNLKRQGFLPIDVGRYKANVLANRVLKQYHYHKVQSHCFNIDTETAVESLSGAFIRDNNLFILCVDNIPSRLAFWNLLFVDRSVNVMLMDLGNTDIKGQVITQLQFNGARYGCDTRAEYPDEYKPTNTTHHSCEDEVVTVPQTITANLLTATLALDNLILFNERNQFYGAIEWINTPSLLASGKRVLVDLEN